MALVTWSTTPNFTTSALFQAEVTHIHNALSSIGLVQTSDTGQCNPATIAVASAASTAQGYEIWAFADSLQSAYPCYIKIEYGSGNATTCFGLWVTVGNATDGAGNLTGSMKTTRYAFTQANASSSSFTSGLSGSTSRVTLAFCTGAGSGYGCLWFTVERIQDASGADTTTGVAFVAAVRTASSVTQCIYYGTNRAQPASSSAIGALLPNEPTATTWANGNNVGTSPIIPIGWGLHPAIQGGLCYFNGDLPALTTYLVTTYGNTHTYMTLGSSSIGSLATHNGAVSIMTRWD